MVKDNKFAAEPTADATADAKITRDAKNITTTENLVHADKDKKTEERIDNASGSKESKIYAAHVKGSNVDSIALEMKMDSLEVFQIIRDHEAKNAKNSSKSKETSKDKKETKA